MKKIRRPDKNPDGGQKMTGKTRTKKSKFRRKLKNFILMTVTNLSLAAMIIVVATGEFTATTLIVGVAAVVWILLFYIANAVAV